MCGVIACFGPKFRCHGNGVGRGRICLASYNSSTPRTPVIRKDLRDISYISRVKPILSQISLPWKRWLVVIEFVWRHSIARPRKPPDRRKHLRDISYTSQVMDDFVPNFDAMAMGVGRGWICQAPFNSPTPKTPCYTQRSHRYLLHKPSYSRFCSKFRCHGNRGNPEVNFNDAVK